MGHPVLKGKRVVSYLLRDSWGDTFIITFFIIECWSSEEEKYEQSLEHSS